MVYEFASLIETHMNFSELPSQHISNMNEITYHLLSPSCIESHIPDLSRLFSDTVHSGALLNFLTPFPPSSAEAWWIKQLPSFQPDESRPHNFLFVAKIGEECVGCVILIPHPQQNAPFRAEVGKLMVSQSVRGRGVARQLMAMLEEEAKKQGRTIVLLDTAESDAVEVYRKLGWIQWGQLPNVALTPDGKQLLGGVAFYKDLSDRAKSTVNAEN